MKKVKKTIELFNHFYQKNFKIIIIFNIIILFSLLLYCWPLYQFDWLNYIFKSIFLFLFFVIMSQGAKLNKYTGTTDFFSDIPLINFYYTYSLYGITFLIFITNIAGLIQSILIKDFSYSVLLMPTVIGIYLSAKAVSTIEEINASYK